MCSMLGGFGVLGFFWCLFSFLLFIWLGLDFLSFLTHLYDLEVRVVHHLLLAEISGMKRYGVHLECTQKCDAMLSTA